MHGWQTLKYPAAEGWFIRTGRKHKHALAQLIYSHIADTNGKKHARTGRKNGEKHARLACDIGFRMRGRTLAHLSRQTALMPCKSGIHDSTQRAGGVPSLPPAAAGPAASEAPTMHDCNFAYNIYIICARTSPLRGFSLSRAGGGCAGQQAAAKQVEHVQRLDRPSAVLGTGLRAKYKCARQQYR